MKRRGFIGAVLGAFGLSALNVCKRKGAWELKPSAIPTFTFPPMLLLVSVGVGKKPRTILVNNLGGQTLIIRADSTFC
jgi:hypothetical protein